MKLPKHVQKILIETFRSYLERTEELNDKAFQNECGLNNFHVDEVHFVVLASPNGRDSEIICDFFYSLGQKSVVSKFDIKPF